MKIFCKFIVCIWVLLISLSGKAQIDSTSLLRDIRTLSSFEFAGRKPGTAGHADALRYLQNRFGQIGLRPFNSGYIHAFKIQDDLAGQNLIGYIPGKLSDRYMVISGHYDHVGIRQGEVYPGADDNASGVSALLAIAAYYSKNQPNHSLIFAAFDAEEMGLRGAHEFVKNPSVPIEQILLNINMDMVSRNDEKRLVAAGTYHTPDLIPMLDQVKSDVITLIKGYDVPGTGREDWTRQSDHGAFHAIGIPFIYFGVEDHPDYHTPRDTFENIQPTFFYHAVQTVLEAIKVVDRELPATRR